jgi:hypothetical protein
MKVAEILPKINTLENIFMKLDIRLSNHMNRMRTGISAMKRIKEILFE